MSFELTHNSFHLLAPAVEELPHQDLLAQCDKRFSAVVHVGLSAIAHAAQENPGLLEVEMLDNHNYNAIHPEFKRQAGEVPGMSYLAQSGAAIIGAALAAQRLMKHWGTDQKTLKYENDNPCLETTERTVELAVDDPHSQYAAGQLLVPAGGRMVERVGVLFFESGPSGSLQLGAEFKPNKLYLTRSYFVDLSTQYNFQSWERAARAKIGVGEHHGMWGHTVPEAQFDKLVPFTMLLNALVSPGEGAVPDLPTMDHHFHPQSPA